MSLNKISIIVGIIIGITTIVGICYSVDSRYAKDEQVVLLASRLDQKIVQDRVNYLQEQLWRLNDRYRNRPKPPDIIDRERRLRKDLRAAERALDRIRRRR